MGSESNKPIVQISNLQFSWAKHQIVLDIPYWSINSGERVFLYGPSGSGKTTLLSVLGGVLKPQTGQVVILNEDLSLKKPSQRDRFRVDHIGFIFQQFNLIPYLSIIENVLLPCQFSNVRYKHALSFAKQQRLQGNDKQQLNQVAGYYLQSLDLKPTLWKKRVTELSVGQQQRVAAARAFIGQPELIIADEPTSSLDANRQLAFLDLLKNICNDNNTTLLYVSHDERLTDFFNVKISIFDLNRASVLDIGDR